MKHNNVNHKLGQTSVLPSSLFISLPKLIREACNQFESQREKDLFLTALLGVLSGCIPGISGRYHTIRLYPNLYIVIVAPAGNGKSAAIFAKHMGQCLHEARREKNSTDRKVLQRIWGQYISADISSARFLEQLHQNGGMAIIFATEIDTLVNSFSQEWGNFSSNLREGFQHESISYSRKTGDINIEIEKPKLSMVLTGTPQQFLKLIPSSENGLFSRLLIYGFKQDVGSISVRPKEVEGGFEEYFKEKGNEVLEMASFLEQHEADFVLSDSQWNAFDAFINGVIEDASATHGEEAHSSSLRLGIITFRIAMILSAVRKWENKDTGSTLSCTEEDFDSAIALSRVYIQHALTMLELLPKTTTHEHQTGMNAFYTQLPARFTRAEAIEIAKKGGIVAITADRALKYLVGCGKLSKIGQGQYAKPD